MRNLLRCRRPLAPKYSELLARSSHSKALVKRFVLGTGAGLFVPKARPIWCMRLPPVPCPARPPIRAGHGRCVPHRTSWEWEDPAPSGANHRCHHAPDGHRVAGPLRQKLHGPIPPDAYPYAASRPCCGIACGSGTGLVRAALWPVTPDRGLAEFDVSRPVPPIRNHAG